VRHAAADRRRIGRRVPTVVPSQDLARLGVAQPLVNEPGTTLNSSSGSIASSSSVNSTMYG
jgi:hypothetical protein